MNTFHRNRVQSAYPRSFHQPTENGQESHVEQRPNSSTTTCQSNINLLHLPAWRMHQSNTNILNLPAWETQQSDTNGLKPPTRRTQQSDATGLKLPEWRIVKSSYSPKSQSPPEESETGSRNEHSSNENLYSDEIERLLRCLEHDEESSIQVDCLANYRRLVQTTGLRQILPDYKSLCALQQRENRIVQQNACRDVRFLSLLDALEPLHVIKIEQNDSNHINRKGILEYH